MIFYFTGTGNSQFVARRISEHLNDEVVSINKFLKADKAGVFTLKSPLVFVLPTYAWRIPKAAEEWIKKSQFKGERDAYFILTCGDSVGNAGLYAKKLCKDKGLNFCGLAPIIMPENYLALFPTPDKTQSQKIIEKSKTHIKRLAEHIEKRDHFPLQKVSIKDKILSGIVNFVYYPFVVKDRGFKVDDTCTSCNKCEKVCPLNNIKMVSGRPVWQGTCTHCMACIACCPSLAIEYKKASRGRHRHYIVEERPD